MKNSIQQAWETENKRLPKVINTPTIDDDRGVEAKRRGAIGSRIRMLRDDYKDAVIGHAVNLFKGESSMIVMGPYFRKCAQNVYKGIISQLSRIYKNPPSRSFLDQSGKPVGEAEAEVINALYDQARINSKLKYANLLLNAVNDLFLMPVIRNGKLAIDIITPDVCRVIESEDDPTKIDELWIYKWTFDERKREKVKYWVVWTPTEHYWMVESGGKNTELNEPVLIRTPIPDNPDMINPYGIIPAIDVHRYASECSFWDETTGADLYDLNIVVAVRDAMLDYASVWQSFKQVTLTGSEPPDKSTVLAPDAILSTSHPDAEWGTLDLHANFDVIRNDLERKVAAVSRFYGISLDQFSVPDQKSGVAKKIDNQVLLDNLTDQVEIWRDAEARLWEVIKVVCDVQQVGAFDAALSIRFADLTMDSGKEALENDEKRMELGLVNPADVYMKYNYTVTDKDEALKLMAENIKKYQALRPSPLKYGIIENGAEGQKGEEQEE